MKQMARTEAESKGWPILEPIAADELPRPVAIHKDVCVVGTRPEVNLKLSSPLVSRTHAIFVADRDSIYLRDLASLNHTYLNEQPIREAVLRDGDVIGLGPLSFRCKSGFDRPYESGEDAHAPAAELMSVNDGTRIPLTSRSTLIGSRDDCDVVLPGRGVEPSHAIIFEREGRRYIRDLRTVCGTWVNDKAVGQIELNDGDEIRIAQTEFVYQFTHEEAPAEEAALPLAAEPGVEAINAGDDERVELELADDTAGAIPESIGLSDWDATAVKGQPPFAATAEGPEAPVAEREDSTAGGAIPLEAAPAAPSAAEIDDDVIPIRLEDLSDPLQPEMEAEPASSLSAHPGQHDRLGPEEEPADPLDALAEAVAETQSSSEGSWAKDAEEPHHDDRPGASRHRESRRAGDGASDKRDGRRPRAARASRTKTGGAEPPSKG